jgi:hypothetical protein
VIELNESILRLVKTESFNSKLSFCLEPPPSSDIPLQIYIRLYPPSITIPIVGQFQFQIFKVKITNSEKEVINKMQM